MHVLPTLTIDTNLTEVSPQAEGSAETTEAIQQLSTSIEQRVILLVQGPDEDQVYDAGEALRLGLDKLKDITVIDNNEVLTEKLVSKLSIYRFLLLSESQQSFIASKSPQQIALLAKQKLYSIDSSGRALSFDKDPLGIHSDVFSDLFSSASSTFSNREIKQGFAQSISIIIDRGAMNMDIQQSLNGRLTSLVQQVQNEFNVSVDRSGLFFFAADAASKSKSDMTLIGAGSTVGVIALLLLAFGSIRSLLLPIASIFIGISFAFLTTHFIYGKVHILTIVFGASLIGIVIDYSLHYFYHRSNQQHNADSYAALQRALMLSLATSLIGYAALSFSELLALKKVAVFSCLGLLMAWLSVVCLGDWATRKPVRLSQQFFPVVVTRLDKLLGYIPLRFWWLLSITIVLSAGTIVKFAAPYNDDPSLFFKPSNELIESERKVAAVTNDYEPGRYIVIHGNNSAKVYERYDKLVNRVTLSQQIKASDLSSLLSWVPSQAQQQNNYQQYAKIYQTGGASDLLKEMVPQGGKNSITQVQIEYQNAESLSLTPEIIMQQLGSALPPLWVSVQDAKGSPRVVSFVLLRKGVNTQSLDKLVAGLDGTEYINALERTRVALTTQRVSASELLVFAFLLISVLVVIRYRSMRALWMLAVPLCSTAGFIVLMFLAGIPLNLFHTMALFLVLGFGMDYTIFTKEMSTQSQLQHQLSLQAILLSALTSILSFGLLGLSSTPVVASFGLTLLLGNIFNLLGVFVAAKVLYSTNLRES